MKLTKTINAPQGYVFDKIIESVLFDIERATKRKLNDKLLQGFEYRKAVGGQATALIKIDKFEKPQTYAFSTETDGGHYHTSWSIKALGADKSEVMIIESMKAKSLLQSFNNLLMWAFMSTTKKRSMRLMLDKMEESYERGK